MGNLGCACHHQAREENDVLSGIAQKNGVRPVYLDQFLMEIEGVHPQERNPVPARVEKQPAITRRVIGERKRVPEPRLEEFLPPAGLFDIAEGHIPLTDTRPGGRNQESVSPEVGVS